MADPSPSPVFSGVGVALVTLFDDTGALDTAATAAHAERMAEAGLQAIVVAGSTGEAAALDRDERVRLITAVREAVGTATLIAGTGAASARQAAQLTGDAREAGADAVLVLSPPHMTEPGPYYAAVATAAGPNLPLLAYHFPKMSPPGMTVEQIAELPVVGVKDSTGDPARLLALLTRYAGATYVGSSALLALAGPLGATGAILALANAEPEDCIAAFAGDAEAQLRLAPSHLAMAPSPHGIKRLTAARFGTNTISRMS